MVKFKTKSRGQKPLPNTPSTWKLLIRNLGGLAAILSVGFYIYNSTGERGAKAQFEQAREALASGEVRKRIVAADTLKSLLDQSRFSDQIPSLLIQSFTAEEHEDVIHALEATLWKAVEKKVPLEVAAQVQRLHEKIRRVLKPGKENVLPRARVEQNKYYMLAYIQKRSSGQPLQLPKEPPFECWNAHRGANFIEAELSHPFFLAAYLRDAKFTKAQLMNAQFSLSDLTDADFQRADLKGAQFMGARLDRADFRNATSLDDPRKFTDSSWRRAKFDDGMRAKLEKEFGKVSTKVDRDDRREKGKEQCQRKFGGEG